MSTSPSLLRSQQFPAMLLLFAAAVGLFLANTPAQPALAAVLNAHIAVPGTALDLSIAHWISDGLLAIFFFVVAIELRYELTRGELNSASKAVQPAIAAAGGIIVPILVFLWFAGGSADTASGWPIPTATDIAFALGVLAVFGKGLPTAVRAFLLALAILDDIIGIIFIAVLFAHDLQWPFFIFGVVGAVLFWVLSTFARGRAAVPVSIALLVLGVVTWGLIASSGVHATIAGVLLGLGMSPKPAERVRHALEPWVNVAILPLFAFAAAFVVIPALSLNELSPAFWGIAVALPVGKLIGIGVFGWIAMQIKPRGAAPAMPLIDILAAGALGGIGFTVSLLLANLAYASDAVVRDQAILGVLVGSLISLILSGFAVSLRARWYRQMAATAS